MPMLLNSNFPQTLYPFFKYLGHTRQKVLRVNKYQEILAQDFSILKQLLI